MILNTKEYCSLEKCEIQDRKRKLLIFEYQLYSRYSTKDVVHNSLNAQHDIAGDVFILSFAR